MAEAESNLAVVQEIMGHSDIRTTRKYTHPTRKQKAEAVERMIKRRTKVQQRAQQGGKSKGDESP